MNVNLPEPDFVSAVNTPAWRFSQFEALFEAATQNKLVPVGAEVWMVVGNGTYAQIFPKIVTEGFEQRNWMPTRPYDFADDDFARYAQEQLQNLAEWSAQFSFIIEPVGTSLSGAPFFHRLHVEFLQESDFFETL